MVSVAEYVSAQYVDAEYVCVEYVGVEYVGVGPLSFAAAPRCRPECELGHIVRICSRTSVLCLHRCAALPLRSHPSATALDAVGQANYPHVFPMSLRWYLTNLLW